MVSIALAGWHAGRPRTQYVHQADLELRKNCLPLPPRWIWSPGSDRNVADKYSLNPGAKPYQTRVLWSK